MLLHLLPIQEDYVGLDTSIYTGLEFQLNPLNTQLTNFASPGQVFFNELADNLPGSLLNR